MTVTAVQLPPRVAVFHNGDAVRVHTQAGVFEGEVVAILYGDHCYEVAVGAGVTLRARPEAMERI